MKTKTVIWADERSRVYIRQALLANKVVVGSSDTVLGLLANTTDAGFMALNAIKNRLHNPYLILVASKDHVTDFVAVVSSDAQRLMDLCWPGPLTLILPAKPGLADYMGSDRKTVALRVPNHAGLLAILSHFKGLFSTSANITGCPVPDRIEDIDPTIIEKVAYAVVDEQEAYNRLPSTIIDCTGLQVHLVRQGFYTRATIEEFLGKKIV